MEERVKYQIGELDISPVHGKEEAILTPYVVIYLDKSSASILVYLSAYLFSALLVIQWSGYAYNEIYPSMLLCILLVTKSKVTLDIS